MNNEKNFKYIVSKADCPAALCEIIAITRLALKNNIEVKWHTEPSSYSCTILDSKAQDTTGKVTWSKRAYVAVKFLEPNFRVDKRQLVVRRKRSEPIDFQSYIDDLNRIWDTHSRTISEEYIEALTQRMDLALQEDGNNQE